MSIKIIKHGYIPYNKTENSIRKDEIFRFILGRNENARLIKDFLQSILQKNITNIVVKNDFTIQKSNANSKEPRLDILAEINNNEKINIEIQTGKEYNIYKRSNYYASQIISDSLRNGKNYSELPKVIIIWLLDYNEFPDKDYHVIGSMRDQNNNIITEETTYHFFQLQKFYEQLTEVKTPEEQWLAYISHQLNKKELEELYKMNRSFEEIDQLIEEYLNDEEMQYYVDSVLRRKNKEMLIQEYAFEQGSISKQQEIAKKLLQKGNTIQEISEITGLNEEEIEKLK